MKQRERGLCSINHNEPDRVPIDLGGLDVSGISAIAYKKLRSYLGLNDETIRIVCVMQQLADVSDDVIEAVRADMRPVFIRAHYKPGRLSDGFPCEIPETWNTEFLEDGEEVVRNKDGEISLIRPSDGHFFDPVHHPLKNCETVKDLDRHIEFIRNMGMSFNLPKDLGQALGEAGEFVKNRKTTPSDQGTDPIRVLP